VTFNRLKQIYNKIGKPQLLFTVVALMALIGGIVTANNIQSQRDLLAGFPKESKLADVTITEYWPVPESWFRGAFVSAPGIPGTHRVDWLYSGTGLSMEEDGIGLDGKRYHVQDLGPGGWVNASGQATMPTQSGNWTRGDPAWRASGWRTRSGAVTFPLPGGRWQNGAPASYKPPSGASFGLGPSLPLVYWQSVAVDPKVIAPGSRIYIPAYRNSPSRGWFRADDTGTGIIGRHIDVFTPPPASPDGGKFLTGQRVAVIAPAPPIHP
jgi:hypothetical protein